MSDINPEKIHDKNTKCPSKFRGMSAINHVNVGQNVRCFEMVFIYTDILMSDVLFLNHIKSCSM